MQLKADCSYHAKAERERGWGVHAGLTALDIRYCPVHNTGVSLLLADCPHLEVLLLEGCPVSTLKVLSLYWNHPGLRIWNKGKALLCHPPPARGGGKGGRAGGEKVLIY